MFDSLKRQLIYYYVSSLDQALYKFRKTKPMTASQRAEYNKYQEIFKKRDCPPQSDNASDSSPE
ncbi:hypothetical protein OAT84_02825 [Gammaproteobacteria bacterium]|nr:hypothetical protein [Gammaproteobacteria bacterium]